MEIDRINQLKCDAYEDGLQEGSAAVRHAQITHHARYDSWMETGDEAVLRQILLDEAYEAEMNSRQYSGHPVYELQRLDVDEFDRDAIYEKYEEGVMDGIRDSAETDARVHEEKEKRAERVA
jgi:hypothetical protein